MRNTRRYGGYIVHMGMVLILSIGWRTFNQNVQKEMRPLVHAAREVTSSFSRVSIASPEANYNPGFA